MNEEKTLDRVLAIAKRLPGGENLTHKDVVGISTCAFMLVVFLLYLLITRPPSETPSTNELAIGVKAKQTGIVNVPVFMPQPLSGLSRKAVLSLRAESVRQSGDLLLSEYSPTGEVFAKMQDGLPWFSLKGFFVSGRSKNSTNGPSAEARYIANPYLLVAPEFWGISRWSPGGAKWNWKQIRREEFNNPEFPYYVRPHDLTWRPSELIAEVKFSVSEYIRKVNAYLDPPLAPANYVFGLSAYNARDFGFNYLALDKAGSVNIQSADNAETPVQITDRITALPRFCAYDSVCNHADVPMLDADAITAGPLPATAVVKLWVNPPADKDAPANMLFTILIE